jgi:hypothetical protein
VNTNSGKNKLDRWMKAISLSLIGLVLLLALLAMTLLGYFADDTIIFNNGTPQNITVHGVSINGKQLKVMPLTYPLTMKPSVGTNFDNAIWGTSNVSGNTANVIVRFENEKQVIEKTCTYVRPSMRACWAEISFTPNRLVCGLCDFQIF